MDYIDQNTNNFLINQSFQCIYCKNPSSMVGLCQNFHYVCYQCQNQFPRNCPICMEDYLPQDNLLLETVLAPLNEAKLQNDLNTDVWGQYGTLLVNNGVTERKKKSPVDTCKENFFLAVWDAFACAMYTGCMKKNNKNRFSVTESLSKILSRVTRKMGKSIYNLVLAKYPKDKKTFQVSLGLLILLIGAQLVMKRVVSRSSSVTFNNFPQGLSK